MMILEKPRCRHCRRPSLTKRPRGLCWNCYYAPGVRELYPSQMKLGRELDTGGGGKPCEPTAARPGSEAKIAAMQQRAALGQSLWHEKDGRLGTRVVPVIVEECDDEED